MKTKHLFLLISGLIFILAAGCEKEEFDSIENLIGEWQLIRSCGGFTGECSYPDDDCITRILFTPDSMYYRYFNDKLVREYKYSLGDVVENEGVTYYKITFIPFGEKTGNSEWSTAFYFIDRKYLNIPGGDYVEEFKRIK